MDYSVEMAGWHECLQEHSANTTYSMVRYPERMICTLRVTYTFRLWFWVTGWFSPRCCSLWVSPVRQEVAAASTAQQTQPKRHQCHAILNLDIIGPLWCGMYSLRL